MTDSPTLRQPSKASFDTARTTDPLGGGYDPTNETVWVHDPDKDGIYQVLDFPEEVHRRHFAMPVADSDGTFSHNILFFDGDVNRYRVLRDSKR
jgi:hypothetical protein